MPISLTTPPISPPPGQQDQSACLAAPASVGQVGGTNTRFLTVDEYAAVDRVVKHVMELRALRTELGTIEFKRLGYAADLRVEECFIRVVADWLLEADE